MGELTKVEEDYPPVPERVKLDRLDALHKPITLENVQLFFTELAKTGRISASAKKAGLILPTISRLRKRDDDFADMFEEAMQTYRDTLEQECHRRAVEGWDEEIFSQRTGMQIGTVKKFDGRLLELMLKRHIPEYREKFESEIKISGGVLIAPAVPVSDKEWEEKFGGEKAGLIVEHNQPKTLPEATT